MDRFAQLLVSTLVVVLQVISVAGAATQTPQPDRAAGLAAFEAGKYHLARSLLTPLAEKGDAKAQLLVGKMYAAGRGGSIDGNVAAEWFRRAANQGDSEAQYSLGRMYETGWGVAANNQRAIAWYRKAAAQGHARAQLQLARLSEQEQGVREEEEKVDRGHAAVSHQQLMTPKSVEMATETTAEVNSEPVSAAATKSSQPLREEWVRTRNKRYYSIQLLSSRQESEVLDYIATHGLSGEVAYFLSERRGQPWYNLIYGVYPSLKDAHKALSALPEVLKKEGPWIRRFRDIQASIIEP